MAGPAATVNDRSATALVRRIARADEDFARLEAVALGLVDGLLEGDHETLAAALDALRDARARATGDHQKLTGWLDAAIAFAYWGLERVPSPAAVAQGTQAHEFLLALDRSLQLHSADLRRLLGVDETQVSRTGRRLLESGLVTRRKVGRQVFWQTTPRGRRALEEAPGAKPSRNSDFWQAAFRRGFEAARGNHPSERTDVDRTRQRITASAFELHKSRGVQATTWAEIADKAGLPEETVRALFRTYDDLVRSCGEHIMESLQLPPADRAPEVFAGTSSDLDRIHRLVATLFDVYERAADVLTVGRRERNDVPAVDESIEALEQTLDALIVHALGPQRADRSSVTAVKALTDLEVWRTLRDHGATPDAAVDQASAAVARWLDAQPARFDRAAASPAKPTHRAPTN